MMPPLSVLDLSPVPAGTPASEALANTVDLARRAEELGYHRYWLAEHHSTPGLASSAPEVMIGHVAAATETIRVGSGGIMLPNHSPLRIAETFRVLAALHPGRIDLGIGRAPGGTPAAAYALRRSAEAMDADLPALLAEMEAYVEGGLAADHPLASVRALPDDVPLPPIWILGSTSESAALAAALGTGYAFAHHLGPRRARRAMQSYRAGFQPSATFPEPHAILTLSAFCAEDEGAARSLAWPLALSVIRMRSGRPADLAPPREAERYEYTPAERQQLERFWRAQVVGDPRSLSQQITQLAGETAADEVMLMTTTWDHGARCRSYELLADFRDRSRRSAVA